MSSVHSRLRRGLLAALMGAGTALALAVPTVWAAEPAGMTLRVEGGPEGGSRVVAVVVDAQGAPVEEVAVAFKVRTSFGWLPIGEGFTDAAGRIQAPLPDAPRATQVAAEAGYEAPLRAVIRMGAGSIAVPAVRPGRDVLSALSPQPGVISPYPVPLLGGLLAVVLGGIWATYGYVVWLLTRIRTGG